MRPILYRTGFVEQTAVVKFTFFEKIGAMAHPEFMKTIKLGSGGPEVPAIAVGCMRISDKSDSEAAAFISGAMEAGLNFFDHADIYGAGTSEEVFARGLSSAGIGRGDVILQSKCGIREGMYDFSGAHILKSVDGILRRLETDYLDILLLHRPDVLMEPEEIAVAFDQLKESGKVRHFGVSNQNPGQMELLRRSLTVPLIANQMQLSLAFTGMIDSGLNVNTVFPGALDRDGGVWEYCRLHGIAVQAWSPFQYGFFEGVFIGSPKFPELNAELQSQSAETGLSPSALAIAWLLRLPGTVQPVTGTSRVDRLKDIAAAAGHTMSREDWYALYRAAGNDLP